jgi:acetyl coenzyme A synthetase (ADP forming)-like protein
MQSDLTALFAPHSVAVIGASRDRNTIGREILHNLIDFGFEGPVYPVNPNARSVHSLRAYPSIAEVPDQVDLAVVVVPAPHVLPVVRESIACGVRAFVTISAGFREAGATGAKREAELRALLREHQGVRMVGPNCMGMVNTDPRVRLNASFAASRPVAGSIAFASQSGALGEAILATATELGIGLSSFVSLGNKTDVSGNDLLEHWEQDPRTSVILLYLESFGNPHKFSRIARRITRAGKPIVVVKSGRSAAGARATESHTGSLSGLDEAATTLLEQCGVLRVDEVSELFTVGRALANQPLPAGDRVAILTNAGGPGIMAADAAARHGLTMAEFSPQTQRALDQVLPDEASTANPVDTIATATGPIIERCCSAMLVDPGVDALLVIFVAPATIDTQGVAAGIAAGAETARAAGSGDKPVLCTFMGGRHGSEGRAFLQDRGLPVYDFPETAVRALTSMVRYRRWLTRPEGQPLLGKVDVERAGALIDAALEQNREWLTGEEAAALLECAGVPVVPRSHAAGADEAAAMAETLGFPVVLKVEHPSVLHKSDVGGVALDLQSAEEVRSAAGAMRAALVERGLDAAAATFLVQPHLKGGVETIVGAVEDPMVGHLVLFGLGGTFVELVRDVALRVHPLTDLDLHEMVREIRGAQVLRGFRGQQPVDLKSIERAIAGLDALLGAFPQIREVDINPFLAFPDGSLSAAVDARVRIGVPGP